MSDDDSGFGSAPECLCPRCVGWEGRCVCVCVFCGMVDCVALKLKLLSEINGDESLGRIPLVATSCCEEQS